jgi:hypothetical protein
MYRDLVARQNALGGAAIDFAAVSDLDDFNGARDVIDGIDNAKLALANAKAPFGADQLLTAGRPWLIGKRDNTRDDALAIFFRSDGLNFLRGGRFD